MVYLTTSILRKYILIFVVALVIPSSVLAQNALFEYIGPSDAVNLPSHAVVGQDVRINRRALLSPTLSIELFGEAFVAERTHIDRQHAGQIVWTGYLQGQPGNTVIIILRANAASGLIQDGASTYRIGGTSSQGNRLYLLDLDKLPPEDLGGLPDGGGEVEGSPAQSITAGDGSVEDLLVVYNQAACDGAGSCTQLEADIVTAVADMNSAYAQSEINITMNLVGIHQTVYPGTDINQALYDLRGTSDGEMDEVHGIRDSLGADIVAMIYEGSGCGLGYLSSSASTAFSVTAERCLVGNRTMAHEIGHNQGAHHDRQTVGGGTTGAYSYGYRRCNDGSVDDFGSPFFRTILSYGCSGASRVGRFSNPNVNYSGVPQGVDPDVDPERGAYNARTLNESAAYVAGFRDSPPTTAPNAPSALSASASGPDIIDLVWSDNSDNENNFEIHSSTDGSSWSLIATLAANITSYTDNGLTPETEYFYRVQAVNNAGSSAWSNTASTTTFPQSTSIEDLANGEVLIKGAVSGSYTDTYAADGSAQKITEEHSGGKPSTRWQSYEHAWTFDVVGGAGGVVVSVDAWVSGNEGANFYYSLDGGTTRYLMFIIDNNASIEPQIFALPPGTSGPVRIEVQDATQTRGEAVDSVSVDHIVLTSYTDAGDPPASPSAMSVTATASFSVSVQFTDNSENEFGFELWRATIDPDGDCMAGSVVETLSASAGFEPVTHTDNTVSPSTTYWYWAVSFNGAGDNGSCSSADLGTTDEAPSISLTVSPYKIKGKKYVDLTWSGAGTPTVDIYRDGDFLVTVANTGTYTDDTGQKGGSAITYQVCEKDSNSSCSPEQVAVF